MESDENSFLRRRLEAIERTTLKLNIGGVSNDLQILRERLELEAAEVSRLRGTVAALQNDKVIMTEVRLTGLLLHVLVCCTSIQPEESRTLVAKPASLPPRAHAEKEFVHEEDSFIYSGLSAGIAPQT